MNILLSNKFATKLGMVETRIESNLNDSIIVNNNNLLTTSSHRILLQNFELNPYFLGNSSNSSKKVESTICWRWFVEKIDDTDEQLNIFCELINPGSDVSCDPDSGENLDSVEIENAIQHLHIGTEDGDIMRYRASQNDFMPQRFTEYLGFGSENYSFTEYIDFGFKTTIPKLKQQEQIYFHFLVATNTIKASYIHPNERDISTWLAVDCSKRYLDKYFEDLKTKNT